MGPTQSGPATRPDLDKARLVWPGVCVSTAANSSAPSNAPLMLAAARCGSLLSPRSTLSR